MSVAGRQKQSKQQRLDARKTPTASILNNIDGHRLMCFAKSRAAHNPLKSVFMCANANKQSSGRGESTTHVRGASTRSPRSAYRFSLGDKGRNLKEGCLEHVGGVQYMIEDIPPEKIISHISRWLQNPPLQCYFVRWGCTFDCDASI